MGKLEDFRRAIMDPSLLHEEEEKLRKELEKSLSVGKEDQTKEFSNLLTTCLALANIYQVWGRLDEARSIIDRVLMNISNVPEKTLNLKDIELLGAIHNNSGIIHRKMGNFTKAISSYEKAITLREQAYKKSPEKYVNQLIETQMNLGVVLRKSGKKDAALKQFQDAVEMREKFGINDDDSKYQLANLHSNLGALSRDMGDPDAKKEYLEAISIRKSLVDTNPIDYATSYAHDLNAIGTIQNDASEFKDALRSYNEALNAFREIPEENRYAFIPDVAMINNNLGNVYRNMGDIVNAEKTFIRAYDLYKVLVKKEPHVYSRYLKIAMENLRLFYNQTGKPEKAMLLINDTLEFIQKVVGVVDENMQAVQGKIKENTDALEKKKPKKVEPKIGRNDPCPCGSGKKYKKCCWLKDFKNP